LDRRWGPIRSATGGSVWVVSAITGRAVVDVTFTGASNHAGTTPMAMRFDALGGAADLVLAVERVAGGGAVNVATTGSITVGPNVRNVVPGSARLGLDIRDVDDERVGAA